MKVLKFGGTSVADAQNIAQCISVINGIEGKKVVVVSALAGITDALIEAVIKAENKNIDYKNLLAQIRRRHFETIEDLLNKEKQKELSEYVDACFSQINTLLDGCFLLGSCT